MVTATSSNVNHGSFIFGLQRGHYLTGVEGANLQCEAKPKPDRPKSIHLRSLRVFALLFQRETNCESS